MRRILLCVTLCAFAAVAAAAPVVSIDYEDTGKMKSWRKKTNTTVSEVTDGAKVGKAAVRITVEPQKYGFGWMQGDIPRVDYTSAAGVHGYFRPAKDAYGRLDVFVMLIRSGKKPSYFAATVGKLDKKQGEWQEFYIPMSAFKYSRGDIKTLDLPEMQKRTMMEFHLTGLKKDGPVSTVDIDGIEFVDAAGAAEIQKRLK